MQVLQCQEKLIHYEGCLVLSQKFVVDDVLEQLTSFAVLENQEANFVPFPNFVELDDIGMIQLLEDGDFVNKSLKIFNALFLDGFNGKLLLGLPFLSQVDDAETS